MCSDFYIGKQYKSELAQKPFFSRLSGVSSLKGVSLPALSTTENPIKIFAFWVTDFLRGRFSVYQGTKHSKSSRICEYFNEGITEIHP